MSLKPSSAVFRLKRNHKNLTTAENLISYLNNARSCKTITIDDLNNVMRGIMGREMSRQDAQADEEMVTEQSKAFNELKVG